MSAADIMLSKETANDETAVIVAIYVAGGSRVEADQLLFDAESSKATQEIRAPAAGLLAHDLAVGQEVGFGVPLGRITPDECVAGPPDTGRPARTEDARPPSPAEIETLSGHEGTPRPDATPAQAAPPPAEAQDNRPVAALARPASCAAPPHAAAPRFSKAAAALIAEYDLSPATFTSPFVTAAEVRARAHRPQQRGPEGSSPGAAPGIAIGARKRAEIEVLAGGAGGTMLSVLGLGLGRLDIRRTAGSFLEGRIVDLVIYEAARLMRRYPKLNASYDDARLVLHPAVHAGLAIDGGGRLVVYGISDADRTSLADLSDIIADAVARYVEDRLTTAEVTRATFTVTDLSDHELDFVLPLLPRGQSCILGITRTAAGEFRLFAGFDHRVTEGREVSSFLGELRARLLSFSTGDGPATGAAQCLYCERSAAEAVALAKDKGLLRIVDEGAVMPSAVRVAGMAGETDVEALRAYLARLMDRAVTDDEPIALRSVQRAALASWARKNGIALRSGALRSRAAFTLRAMSNGSGEDGEPVHPRVAGSASDARPRSPAVAVLGVGIDIEEVDGLPRPDDHRVDPFFQEHFSEIEIAHCLRQQDVAASFCGTWAAKEAILKAGWPAGRLLDIAVTHDAAGRPRHPGCHLSISYTRQAAVAVCLRLAEPSADRDHPFSAVTDDPMIRAPRVGRPSTPALATCFAVAAVAVAFLIHAV